jgi:hypothetical protein
LRLSSEPRVAAESDTSSSTSKKNIPSTTHSARRSLERVQGPMRSLRYAAATLI